MSGPMCGPALDPRPKSLKFRVDPKICGGNETPRKKFGVGERCTHPEDDDILC